jgi:hypothetical protein
MCVDKYRSETAIYKRYAILVGVEFTVLCAYVIRYKYLYIMRTILTKTKKTVQLFFYTSLAVLLALVGVRQVDNGTLHIADDNSDSNNDSTKDGKGSNFIPYAYADTPHGGDGGGDGCGGGDGGGDGCGCCFPPETAITTPSGVTPIASLAEGDEVIAYDTDTQTFTTAVIAKVLRHGEAGSSDAHDFTVAPLLKFTVTNEQTTATLLLTSNHPVLAADTNEFKPAEEFSVGEQLRMHGGVATLSDVTTTDETEHLADEKVVYNLTLTNGPSTYLAEGVVVHNKDSGDSGGSDCY